MKTSLALLCALFLAGTASAQNYYMAKQQARRVSNANAAEQQRIQQAANGSAANNSASTPAVTAPVDPALQATLNNVASLQSNFAVLNNSAGTPDATQKTSLLNNLSQAAQGTKASTASVQKLADDLVTSVAGTKKLAAAQQIKLAREVHALFNSSHLSAVQQETLLTDVQKILMAGGAPLDEVTNVGTDLKTIITETK